MIMRILALLFLAVSAMATPMQTNTISFAVPSANPTKYSDFSMTWVGLSDQYIDMSFNGITISASDQIYLRLALQRKGSVALEVSGWAIANSNRVIGIVPYTNIPPSGPYYAEVLVKSGTGSPQMVVGFGQIKTESSIFGLSETQKWASTVFISPAYPTNLVLLTANDPTARIWAAGASNLAYAIAPLASNALPRTGGLMTHDIDFTNAGLTSLDFAEFDAAPTGAISARRLQWNAARDTLRLGINSTVNYDLGHQVILYARNADSNTVNKGEVVYISGSSGDNATFMRASNDSETRSARTIGIMAETVAQNNFGNIVNQGTIYNLDTSAFPAGAGLYLGAGGTMQTNLPTAPLHGVFLGVVERSHANVGQIYVTIQNYQELRELSDVRLNGQTNLNVLTYIAASNRWEARSVSSMEADPVWGAVSNSIAMKIGLNSTNIVVSSNAARNASIALSNYFESAMSTASGAVYGAINTASNHLQSSITDVSNHFENASVNSSNAVYASIVASSNHLQSSVIAVSNYFQSAMATASNKFNADIQAVSNLVVGASGIDTNATHQALAASNLAASAYTFATQAHVWAQSGSNLAFQTAANLTAASNSFVANITFASNSLSANIVAASNSLSANLSLASNLAFRADMTAGIARGWAIAASNQASVVATNNYFTSNSIMANLVLASNSLAANIVLSSNAMPELASISNRLTQIATNNYFTSNTFITASQVSNSMLIGSYSTIKSTNIFLGLFDATASTNLLPGAFGNIRAGSMDGGAGIAAGSHGNLQLGGIGDSAYLEMEMLAGVYGSIQRGYKAGGGFKMSIGPDVQGAEQAGSFAPNADIVIGQYAHGSTQRGHFLDSARIGSSAVGASQLGFIDEEASATNNATGAMQLLNLLASESALTTADGYGSILLGPGTNSVAYSVKAAGGFYGNGANVTNVNARQLGGALPSAYLTVSSYQNANTNHLRFLTTTVRPSTPTDPGSHGEVRFDVTNIYIYMEAGGTNMWMRVPGRFTW